MATITTPECIFCNKTTEVEVSADQAYAIRNRTAPIQDILPEITPEQREVLISGIHPDCWTRNFG